MKQSDAYERMCKEYLSKCKACDECIAQCFCTLNQYRTSRTPQDVCPERIKMYLRQLT